MKRGALEVLVGAAVCVVIALLVAGGVSGGFGGSSSGYTLTARYDQADGLAVGNPVHLAGVEIGKVSAMRLDPKSLRPIVEFRIEDTARIPRDSAAMILSDGVLGGKFVKIEPGVENEYLKPGDRFEFVQDSVIVEELLAKIVDAADRRITGKKN
jgi:phospholipid/cholesterol/gamma-HCH transport system substrate-binding protein